MTDVSECPKALDELHERVIVAKTVRPFTNEWDAWADAVTEGARPSLTTFEAWDLLYHWWGSHERAHVLAEWVADGLIDGEALSQPINPPEWSDPLLLDAWMDLKAGGANPREWVRLFKITGYLSDGASVPTEPMTLYRGHSLGRWWGMSWTTDSDVAHWFAQRLDFRGIGLVFRAEVPPRAVLAQYAARNESEVIINPYMLRGPRDGRTGRRVECLGRPDQSSAQRWIERRDNDV